MNTRKCKKCGIEKPLAEFYKNKASKGGHIWQCRTCKCLQVKQRNETPEGKANRRKWNQSPKGKESVRNSNKKYQSGPKFAIAHLRYRYSPKGQATSARYRAENKEEITEKKTKKRSEEPNCVYQIKNLENIKVYIGETIRGESRWKRHLRCLKGNCHANKPLQEDFNKYGEEAFEWSILKEFEIENKDILLLEEARTIQQYIQDGVELYNVQLTNKQLKMLEEDKKSQ
jgi:hypothetical protein